MVKIRSAYDKYDPSEFGITCSEAVKTQQADAGRCDVNNIVARWKRSGCAVDLSLRVGEFLDVADIPDFQTCQNFVQRVQGAFYGLPADLRAQFENDPSAFLAFAADPANASELVKMGLAKPVETSAGLPDSPIAEVSTGAALAATAAPAAGSDGSKVPPVGV